MGKNKEAIIQNLGFKPRKIYLSSLIRTSFQDETFTLDISRGDKLRLLLPAKSSVGFTITERENSRSERLSYLPNFTEELRTGDPEFDRRFSLKSNLESAVTLLFERKDLRNIISALFNGWVTKLEVDGKHITVTISTSFGLDTSPLRNIPQMMIELKRVFTRENAKVKGNEKRTSFTHWIIFVIPVLMALAQVVTAVLFSVWMKKDFQPIRSGELILKTLLIFAPLVSLYLFFSFRLMRNQPSFYTRFSTCLILAIVWLLSFFPFVQAVNGYYDRSVAVKSAFVVVDKVPKARRSQTYILILREYPSEGTKTDTLAEKFVRRLSPLEVKISVSREEFLMARPKETFVVVYIREGALGIRWVDSYTVAKGTRPS